jgi:hypothetical protein
METLLSEYRCKTASEATHLSLVGGKFCIKEQHRDLFQKVYHKMTPKLGAHLVEKVRFPCRWYIDIDKQPGCLEKLKEILRVPCIVSAPEEKDGAHIVFYNEFVKDRQEAIKRTKALLEPHGVPFDCSVWSSGLRMPLSKKSKQVDRIYSPVFRITENGFDSCDSPCSFDDFQKSCINGNPESNLKDWPKSELTTVPCVGTHDFGFIHPEYKNTQVVQVKPMKNYINVFTNNRFCTNIGREHKSNRIYFVIHCGKNNITVTQKCFCKCDHTGCANFKGNLFRMPMVLYFKLKSKVSSKQTNVRQKSFET